MKSFASDHRVHVVFVFISALFMTSQGDALFAVAGMESPPSAQQTKPKKKKAAVPGKSLLRKAEKDIRKLFFADFRRARRRTDRIALAEKLLRTGTDTVDDLVMRFALLSQARDIAVQAQKSDIALRATEELARLHDVDRLSLQADVFRSLARKTRNQRDATDLSLAILAAVDEAVSSGQYALADELAGLAVFVSTRSRDPIIVVESRVKRLQTKALKKRWESYQKAQALLAEHPDNEMANERVGLFLCFDRHDWTNGTVNLRRSQNSKLQDVATREASPSDDPASQLKTGDIWAELGRSAKGLDREFFLNRARYWYRRAVSGLSGVARRRVQSRIQPLDKVLVRKVYLANLKERDVVGGPWGFGKRVKGARNPVPIVFNGRPSRHGLGMHPPSRGFSRVRYHIDGQFGTFLAGAGLASQKGTTSNSPITFMVLGDGKLLWKSKPTRQAQFLQSCVVDVHNVQIIELRVQCPGGQRNGHACWIDPYLLKVRALNRR